MGNCLDASAKIDAAQSSRTSVLQADIDSYSEQSNFSTLPAPRTEEETLSSPNLKSFIFNELKNATRNFRPDCLIGEGRFGYVYKGDLGSGIVVAVKKLKPKGFEGHKELLTEVNYLGQLHHRNLVKLFGYCLEGENRLLVYEFMPKGSLENHLLRRPEPLTWVMRMKVAIDAAKGLAFLHNAQSQVTCRDFKSSNILLDAMFNAKLSDFGFAKAGFLTPKSDVYSFGVVLLELLSGRCVVDKSKAGIEQVLIQWARNYGDDERTVYLIMDTKLERQYPQKGALTAASLAQRCLNHEANARPSMTEVLATLEQIHGPPRVAGKHSQTEQRIPQVPKRNFPARNRTPQSMTRTTSTLPSYR